MLIQVCNFDIIEKYNVIGWYLFSQKGCNIKQVNLSIVNSNFDKDSMGFVINL